MPKTKDKDDEKVDPKLLARQKKMVAVAKLVAKATRIPLAQVSRIIMANGFTDEGIKRSREDCKKMAAVLMNKDLDAMFNL